VAERAVLDASALLALLRQEPGSERVLPLVSDASVSVVNLAETLIVLQRRGIPHGDAERALDGLSLDLVPATVPIAREAARVAASSRRHGLSLGDAFCLATARSLGLPAVTADRMWARLRVGVRVVVIR
jgi:PIN domain nuclease of toxin-antitoxin system